MYHWLVQRGQITVVNEGDVTLLTVDPEGGPSCLLTIRDAAVLGGILGDCARSIWESEQERLESKRVVEELAPFSYRWMLSSGELRVFLDDTSEFLQISLDGTGRAGLPVQVSVELSQVLTAIADAAIENLKE